MLTLTAVGCGGGNQWWFINGTGMTSRVCMYVPIIYDSPAHAFIRCRALGGHVCTIAGRLAIATPYVSPCTEFQQMCYLTNPFLANTGFYSDPFSSGASPMSKRRHSFIRV